MKFWEGPFCMYVLEGVLGVSGVQTPPYDTFNIGELFPLPGHKD